MGEQTLIAVSISWHVGSLEAQLTGCGVLTPSHSHGLARMPIV